MNAEKYSVYNTSTITMMEWSENTESESWCILTSPLTNPYLPPEVWEKVFSKLPSKDLISVADACPEWDELLASKMIFALLEQVLPLLNLNKHDILTLREVSRGAKLAVANQLDTFTQQKLSLNFCYEESTRRKNFNAVIQQIEDDFDFGLHPQFEANWEWIVQNFLTHFGEYESQEHSPFLTRSIVIPIVNSEKEDDYTAILRMLRLYGHHVWKLSVEVGTNANYERDDEGVEEPQVHVTTDKITQLLNLLPNLKSLEFSSHGPKTVTVEQLRLEELPELKHLESLSFSGWYNEPSLPVTFLKRYGPQLTSLEDSRFEQSILMSHELPVETLNDLLPNLKKFFAYRAPTAVQKLAKVNWQLEELMVGCFYEWKLLLDMISNFNQTLVKLKLWEGFYGRAPLTDTLLREFTPPSEAMSKLEVLVFATDILRPENLDEFWNLGQKMWGSIRTLHVENTYYEEERFRDDRFVNKVFQNLPTVERILYWCRIEKVLFNVYTRPDQL